MDIMKRMGSIKTVYQTVLIGGWGGTGVWAAILLDLGHGLL
jgi:hypothetical protein